MIFFQFLYNLCFPLVFFVLLPLYLPRMLRRGGYRATFFQRLGFFDRITAERIGRGRLWVHAVSVGEIFIALKFINNFRKHHPDSRFILSVTTTTALKIGFQHACLSLEVIASPLDFFFVTNHFLKRFQPAALIMVEGDLWPQRLWRCKKMGIPTALISARLSQRSEKRFKIFRPLVSRLWNLLDFIGFPSMYDQERWSSLGVYGKCSQVTGNLKFDQVSSTSMIRLEDDKGVLAALGWREREPIFLAGSTAGLAEEEEVLKAWLSLKSDLPSLRLVMVPRHVERRHELIALFEKYNVALSLRSRVPLSCADALLLDTTGELQAWYHLASVVFIGKSLGVGGARGGQNLVEPLLLGRPVLVGPFMDNFEPLTSCLLDAKAIKLVHGELEIAAAIRCVLSDPQEAAKMTQRACALLEQDQGSVERTSECVKKTILQQTPHATFLF